MSAQVLELDLEWDRDLVPSSVPVWELESVKPERVQGLGLCWELESWWYQGSAQVLVSALFQPSA